MINWRTPARLVDHRVRVAHFGTNRERAPQLLTRTLVERDDQGIRLAADQSDQALAVDERRARDAVDRDARVVVFDEVLFPVNRAGLDVEAEQPAGGAEHVDAVSVDRGGGARPDGIGVDQHAVGRLPFVSPEDLSGLLVQGDGTLGAVHRAGLADPRTSRRRRHAHRRRAGPEYPAPMGVRQVTFNSSGSVSTIPVSCQSPEGGPRPRNCFQSSARTGSCRSGHDRDSEHSARANGESVRADAWLLSSTCGSARARARPEPTTAVAWRRTAGPGRRSRSPRASARVPGASIRRVSRPLSGTGRGFPAAGKSPAGTPERPGGISLIAVATIRHSGSHDAGTIRSVRPSGSLPR